MANTYRKILDVTTKLMSEKGYYGASIQTIADKAGVSKATVFHYFKSKEELLIAILDELGPFALNGLRTITEDERLSGLEKLREAIRFHLNLVEKKGDMLNLLVSESRHLSKKNKGIYLETHRSYVKLTEKIVKQTRKESRQLFKKLPPRIVTHAILGMCNWAVQWYRERRKLSANDIADIFYEFIIQGV